MIDELPFNRRADKICSVAYLHPTILKTSQSTMAALPVGPNDIAVQFPPGRHAGLPPIYKTLSHPKKSRPGNVYYFIQDVTKKGMEASLAIEDKMKIPYGPKSVAIAKGVWRINDHIFGTKKKAARFSRAERARHYFCPCHECTFYRRRRRSSRVGMRTVSLNCAGIASNNTDIPKRIIYS